MRNHPGTKFLGAVTHCVLFDNRAFVVSIQGLYDVASAFGIFNEANSFIAII